MTDTSKEYAVVVGSANIDIFGRPYAPLVSHDSNPGTIRTSFGGVGRNIAHNLSLMEVPTKFISVFGSDAHATELKNNCKELGIDISCSLFKDNSPSSTYMFITDEEGDMQLAVSDMEISESMTPVELEKRLPLINVAKVCVADANLPVASVNYLLKSATAPIFCDPVSCAKAPKLNGLLSHIHTLTPNSFEAEYLSGVEISDYNSLKQAADVLLNQGVRRVFISLGEAGVFCADTSEHLLLPSIPVDVVNTTGAGDSFMAGLIWAYMHNMSLEKSALAGLSASSICIVSKETISNKICPELLEQTMKEFAESTRYQNALAGAGKQFKI